MITRLTLCTVVIVLNISWDTLFQIKWFLKEVVERIGFFNGARKKNCQFNKLFPDILPKENTPS